MKILEKGYINIENYGKLGKFAMPYFNLHILKTIMSCACLFVCLFFVFNFLSFLFLFLFFIYFILFIYYYYYFFLYSNEGAWCVSMDTGDFRQVE